MEIEVEQVKALIGDLVIQKTILENKVRELQALLEERATEGSGRGC